MSGPMLAVGATVVLCCSSSVAALMMGGDETPTSPGPSAIAPAPPPPPPVVVDVPQEFRTSSEPWGRNNNGRAHMKAHNKGRLDSSQAWSSTSNAVGKWYQLDNGKIAKIVGVAIKGRKNSDQWVKTFKVKYYDAGTWKDVDGGATFTGNTDRDTLVEARFATPVQTRYIRIYPQTWHRHMSLRAGLITNSTDDGSGHKLLNVPGAKRSASSWWKNNDNATWHPQKGVLDNSSGWHPKTGAPSDGSEWYQMDLDTPTKVTGVALQGRGNGNDKTKSYHWQWITTFTAKYKDSAGTWKDVDNGFVFSGVGDKDSVVWAPFNTPVNTTSIRVYPKTWNGWYSGRFDLLGSKSSTETYEIQGYSSHYDY